MRRNGIAYAYLIWLALNGGLSASQFLLYFSAVSGFTQWVTGILDQFIDAAPRRAWSSPACGSSWSWPEPFRFEGGKELPGPRHGRAYELRLENVSFRYPEAREGHPATMCT